ncbi:E3 ubiquitin ligase family protein [Pseudomonas benzenivorans]|uniref:E3 ubiquitin ligase family protein n=1 Tax=Pseudomonas benzenivorans TaxID=556533 RepID=UPI0021082963|nr:E3 ubiquitin ligase family protein [Pseudomonas benzenivorans]
MSFEESLIGLAFSLAATVGGGWWSLRRLSQARHLLDTPTSKIRSAAQGYVEFYGVLREQADTAIVAPLTGKPCLWWRFKIEEYCGDDDKRTWRVVERGCSEGWLLLDDGTGQCLIDPRGAEVRPSSREVWRGNLRHPRGPAQTGWKGWLDSGKRYRYSEERLHGGQPLYAIGEFRSSGGGRQGLDLGAAQGAVIREWKGDFAGLLQRFDGDRNGQLDEREWNRVRLAAQLEAEERHRQHSQRPAQHQMGKPREAQPFILACAGEDELARQFYWQAAGGALLCVAGALATTWLLNALLA